MEESEAPSALANQICTIKLVRSLVLAISAVGGIVRLKCFIAWYALFASETHWGGLDFRSS